MHAGDPATAAPLRVAGPALPPLAEYADRLSAAWEPRPPLELRAGGQRLRGRLRRVRRPARAAGRVELRHRAHARPAGARAARRRRGRAPLVHVRLDAARPAVERPRAALRRRRPRHLVPAAASRPQRRSTSRTAAIVGTHAFMCACDVAGLEALAADTGAMLVFDAAQAFASWHGRPPRGGVRRRVRVLVQPDEDRDLRGRAGSPSFRDPAAASASALLRAYGSDEDYDSRLIGLNGKLSELHAVLGCLTVAGMEDEVAAREAAARAPLPRAAGRRPGRAPAGARPVCARRRRSSSSTSARAATRWRQPSRADGIETRAYFRPLHAMERFGGLAARAAARHRAPRRPLARAAAAPRDGRGGRRPRLRRGRARARLVRAPSRATGSSRRSPARQVADADARAEHPLHPEPVAGEAEVGRDVLAREEAQARVDERPLPAEATQRGREAADAPGRRPPGRCCSSIAVDHLEPVRRVPARAAAATASGTQLVVVVEVEQPAAAGEPVGLVAGAASPRSAGAAPSARTHRWVSSTKRTRGSPTAVTASATWGAAASPTTSTSIRACVCASAEGDRALQEQVRAVVGGDRRSRRAARLPSQAAAYAGLGPERAPSRRRLPGSSAACVRSSASTRPTANCEPVDGAVLARDRRRLEPRLDRAEAARPGRARRPRRSSASGREAAQRADHLPRSIVPPRGHALDARAGLHVADDDRARPPPRRPRRPSRGRRSAAPMPITAPSPSRDVAGDVRARVEDDALAPARRDGRPGRRGRRARARRGSLAAPTTAIGPTTVPAPRRALRPTRGRRDGRRSPRSSRPPRAAPRAPAGRRRRRAPRAPPARAAGRPRRRAARGSRRRRGRGPSARRAPTTAKPAAVANSTTSSAKLTRFPRCAAARRRCPWRPSWSVSR